eukprot:UN16757
MVSALAFFKTMHKPVLVYIQSLCILLLRWFYTLDNRKILPVILCNLSIFIP